MAKHAPGWLYALIPEWGTAAHIKLGSTTAEDPVFALKESYSRAHGRTTILWMMPCADVWRDEKDRMHDYFADHRVYPDRELFAFDSLDHFHDEIDTFAAMLNIWMVTEEHPPVVEDLVTPTGATLTSRRRRATARRQDRRQEAAKRKREAEEEEVESHRARRAEKRDKERSRRAVAETTKIAQEAEGLAAFVKQHLSLGEARDFVTKKGLESALHDARVPFHPKQLKRQVRAIFVDGDVTTKSDHCSLGVKYSSVWTGLRWSKPA